MLHIGRQTGATGDATLKTLTVEASFYDGRTWQPVPLAGRGDHRVATLTHPKGPGYVSLRANATDTDGRHGGDDHSRLHIEELTRPDAAGRGLSAYARRPGASRQSSAC